MRQLGCVEKGMMIIGGTLIIGTFSTLFISLSIETKNPLIALPFLLLVGFSFFTSFKARKIKQEGRKKFLFLNDEGEHINAVLQLVATIINADGKATDSELRYIENGLEEHFGTEKVQLYMNLLKNELLDKNYSHKAIAKFLYLEYESFIRVQIMHLVIGIATADGLMTKNEYQILKEIAIYLKIPFGTFSAILGMFHFNNEWDQKKEQKVYRRSTYTLSLAFQILGINQNSTVSQIKKAYRKLAIKHHPDKVFHLSQEIQMAAKEKFQKISDAYEYIKKHKGFN